MDGNGRWAKQRSLPRTAGHKVGAKILKPLLEFAFEYGIKYVTLYAFSSENWNRPQEEIDVLISLFRNYLKTDIHTISKQDIRVLFIGQKEKFPLDIQEKMIELEKETALNKKGTIILALSYGARDDITEAIKNISSDILDKKISPEEITPSLIKSYLSTHDIPDPDLIIRTSGEQRLSNFLLWESAYSEFYFTDVLWPDFSPEELKKALTSYEQRTRRFGKI